MVYTIPETEEIIELYYKNNESGVRAANLSKQRYASTHISDKVIRELVAKFRETSCILNKKSHDENSVLNEPAELAVMGQVAIDGTISRRQSAASVWRN